MSLASSVNTLCSPAYIWFAVSFVIYIVYLILCLVGSCTIQNMGMTFLLSALYIIGWTFILDVVCRYNHEILAWVLVLLAVILAWTKMDWIGRAHSNIGSQYMDDWGSDDWGSDDWDMDDWNSYFVPANYGWGPGGGGGRHHHPHHGQFTPIGPFPVREVPQSGKFTPIHLHPAHPPHHGGGGGHHGGGGRHGGGDHGGGRHHGGGGGPGGGGR